MRVLIAPDKFAGSLTAVEAAEAIATGWARQAPDDVLDLAPMADGGPASSTCCTPRSAASCSASPSRRRTGSGCRPPSWSSATSRTSRAPRPWACT